ncbi:helix-turn-helix domain-containing protein [Streptomyces albireticuli]
MSSPQDRLLTTVEAAEAAGVTPACIRQWARRGYIRPIARIGKRNLYREDHVLRAERDRRVEATSAVKPANGFSALNFLDQ